YLRRHNHLEVDAEHVIVTVGGTQAIFISQAVGKLLATARGGTARLHCITPTWMKLPANQARILGVPYDDVPLTFVNGVWSVPPMPTFPGTSDDVHMLFVVNPANPISQVFASSAFPSAGSLKLLDVTYEAMLYDGEGHLDLSDINAELESTFIIGSMSKTFAIMGLRIGFVV